MENLSTHEKQLEKQQSKIEEMEKANLEPKTWTMQGEVTFLISLYLHYLSTYLDLIQCVLEFELKLLCKRIIGVYGPLFFMAGNCC